MVVCDVIGEANPGRGHEIAKRRAGGSRSLVSMEGVPAARSG